MAIPQPGVTSVSVHAVHQCHSIVPIKYFKINFQFCTELRQCDVKSRLMFMSNTDTYTEADKKMYYLHSCTDTRKKKSVNGNSSIFRCFHFTDKFLHQLLNSKHPENIREKISIVGTFS
jgi:hypothetical protein